MNKVITGNRVLCEEILAPVKVIKSEFVNSADMLTVKKGNAISFKTAGCAYFSKKGAYVLLDFGKEICGGVRLLVRDIAYGNSDFRFTFGESASEACSSAGEKGATNNYSPRDFRAFVSSMSDVSYGSTGFRFLRLELLEDKPTLMQSIFAVNRFPYFENEAVIKTSDKELNKITETAIYTLKLCMQNGYFWDGIKRDRLIWSGDMHPEIISSLYVFGNNENVKNSLDFLKNSNKSDEWINGIPTYTAWWIISLCDYCSLCGDGDYLKENKEYAEKIFEHIAGCITDDGRMIFEEKVEMKYFLDWQTYETEDAYIGTALLFLIAAEKYSQLYENEKCAEIKKRLNGYINADSKSKQVRAFQILAGRKEKNDMEFLEKNGAAGFSTFMSYYILKADFAAGGKKGIELIKQYFGGMLSRGATSFWEDFDISWLENTCGIDRFPEKGELDIHGDFGKHCYNGFRHSLCHGWSCGVLAFIIECIFGIKFENGGKRISVTPAETDLDFEIAMPTAYGRLNVKKCGTDIKIQAPDAIEIIGQI